MDIGKFLDENHVKTDIPVNGIYQSQMSDLIEEQPVKKVQAKTYKFANWKKVVSQALMMGYHKKDILAKYKANMKVAGNTDQVEKYLDQKDGLVGSIFVDCSCFDKTFDYSRCSSKLKKYHRFAINCRCDNKAKHSMRKNLSDGSIDGLLGQDPVLLTYQKQKCEKCGLPVISSLRDIPRKVLAQVVDELVQNKQIGIQEGQQIKSSVNILSSLRSIFAKKVGQYKFIKSSTKIDKTVLKYGLQDNQLEVTPINSIDSLLVQENPQTIRRDIKIQEVPEELDGVVVQVYQPEVQIDNSQDEITFDNQEFVDKDWFDKKDIELGQNDIVDTDALGSIQVKQYKPEVQVDDKQKQLDGIIIEQSQPQVQVSDGKEQITFDNQEFVDKDWFDKKDIELSDKDFVAKKKQVKVNNDFRFDF